MRLKIRHSTLYHYRREVAFHPHRLMVRPRGGPDIHVLDHTLEVSLPAELSWAQDIFGNLVGAAHLSGQSRELVITSTLDLETTAPAWPIFRIDPRAHAYPFEYTQDEVTDLGALLWADMEPEVASWARTFIRSIPTDTLSLLKDINAGILAAVTYRPREEEGTQGAGETLRVRSGSCRDLAALFLGAVRSLGFGARAVSGYRFDAEEAGGQSHTTHAWAEVFLPGAGWIGFDPTHGRTGGGALIPLAVGRCNAQILPIVGSYAGASHDFLGMEVAVTAERCDPPGVPFAH